LALNILAVYPSFPGKKEIVYMPLGLSYVVAVAEGAGHQVKVLDMHNLQLPMSVLENELRKEEYDLCFLSGFATQVYSMKEITLIIRKISPKMRIVVGGVGVSDIPEIALKYIGADAVAIGECEDVLPDMLSSLETDSPFDGVPTFVFINNGKIVKNPKGPGPVDLNALPRPAYHHFNVDYISKRTYNGEGFRSIHMFTSRGCPFRCEFCINSVLNDQDFLKELHHHVVDERNNAKQRFLSPQRVVDEIKFLKSEYGITDFHFADEEFITQRSRVLEICRAIEPLGITWSTSGRADWATREKLETMKASGCRYVIFGVESGSQKMYDLMGKNADKSKVTQGITNARTVGVDFIPNFMLGHPGETEETVRETIDYCKELNLVYLPSFATLFSNSKMFHNTLSLIESWPKYFEALAKLDYSQKPLFSICELSTGSLIKLRSDGISETFAHMIFGKKYLVLASFSIPLIKISLLLVDIAPSSFRWFVRNIIRKIISVRKPNGLSRQIPPNNLGKTVEEHSFPEEEDGYVDSYQELQKEKLPVRSKLAEFDGY